MKNAHIRPVLLTLALLLFGIEPAFSGSASVPQKASADLTGDGRYTTKAGVEYPTKRPA